MQKPGIDFFRQPAIELAPGLLGTILVRRYRGKRYRARITETEAYVGPHDLACHASKGRTRRTETLFAAGGCAYVYLIYGIHHMLNIVCSVADDPQAVLIRGAVSLDNWNVDLTGPGKLARHFKLSREHDGLDLSGTQLYLEADPTYRPSIIRTKRIGIDYAREWKEELLRFIDTNHVKK